MLEKNLKVSKLIALHGIMVILMFLFIMCYCVKLVLIGAEVPIWYPCQEK